MSEVLHRWQLDNFADLTWTITTVQMLPAVLETHHLDHSCILSVKLWLVIRCHFLVRMTKNVGKYHPYQNMTSYHKPRLYRKNTDYDDAFPVQLNATMHSQQLCREKMGGTRAPTLAPPPALQGLQGRLLLHCTDANQPEMRGYHFLISVSYPYPFENGLIVHVRLQV